MLKTTGKEITTFLFLRTHNKLTRLLFCFIFLFFALCNGQGKPTDTIYVKAYDSLKSTLNGEKDVSFKKSVFITENAYSDNELSYDDFLNQISRLTLIATAWGKHNSLSNYKYSDSAQVKKALSIFAVMKDTVLIEFSEKQLISLHPYNYDFDDFFGKQDWTKMFVTKLLSTNSGNCHSMPFLYKILADELGASKVWLAFAPSHIYIKNRNEKTGWYNTELTSGQFPMDALITASGYISMDAIRSGIYMDTLSNRQAVAQCVLDLAKGYERKTHNYSDSFIVRCCDLVLKFHPNNINAIIYKAETLKRIYWIFKDKDVAYAADLYKDMETLYLKAMDLGYKEMSEKMYRQWLESVIKQKSKYTNQKAVSIVRSKA